MGDSRQLVRTGLLYLQRAVELARVGEPGSLGPHMLPYLGEAIYALKQALDLPTVDAESGDEGGDEIEEQEG